MSFPEDRLFSGRLSLLFFCGMKYRLGKSEWIFLGQSEYIRWMYGDQEIPERDFAVRAWNEVTGRYNVPRGPGCAGRQAAKQVGVTPSYALFFRDA